MIKYLIVAVLFCVGFAWVLALLTAGGGRYYDCSLVEIHPDYPVRVKEACRELRRAK